MTTGIQKVLLVLAILLSIAILPAEPQAQNRNDDALVVFGDSLSDTGNLWLATRAAGQQPAIPPSESPHSPTLAPATVVGNIANGVRALYALGAREVMVLNLPDLGLVPFVPAEVRPAATALSVQHNMLLADAFERGFRQPARSPTHTGLLRNKFGDPSDHRPLSLQPHVTMRAPHTR